VQSEVKQQTAPSVVKRVNYTPWVHVTFQYILTKPLYLIIQVSDILKG
jgi:hypothetical protein